MPRCQPGVAAYLSTYDRSDCGAKMGKMYLSAGLTAVASRPDDPLTRLRIHRWREIHASYTRNGVHLAALQVWAASAPAAD